MQATPECFAHLTQLLQVLAGGRICAVLEVSVGDWGGSKARGGRGARWEGRSRLGVLPGVATHDGDVPALSCVNTLPRVDTAWSP